MPLKYIGIDGGGTKSVCVLGEANGRVDTIVQGKSSNILAKPLDEAKEVIWDLIKEAMNQTDTKLEQMDTVYLSLAGCGRKNDQMRVYESLRSHFPQSSRIIVENDAMGALASGTWGEPGLVLIAGTGSIAYSLNPSGKLLRVGGWGYLLGDEGSGYDIGKNGMAAVLRAFDGRGEKTALTKSILDHYQLESPEELISYVYGSDHFRELIAESAPAVFRSGQAGDEVAEEIVERAVEDLIELVQTASQSFQGDSFPLVLCGGIFNDPYFRNRFVETAKSRFCHIKFLFPELPPAAGAFLLSLKAAGIQINGEVKDRLQKSWRRL